MKNLFLLIFTILSISCTYRKTMPTNQTHTPSVSIYGFTVNTLDGNPVKLEQYRGKTIVILNVASECGFTPQYADWQKWFDSNSGRAVVLAFPSNDFGGQEPGSAEEIATFCQKNYGVTFPVFEKSTVKGSEKAPIYQWLTDPAQNGWCDMEPSWNFCKYVVNEKGELVAFFNSRVKPDDPNFIEEVGF